MTNWPEYNEALRQRADLNIWFDEDLLPEWYAPASGKRGGQPVYSDLAIEICLILRLVFGQPLRQTQGLVRSLLKLALPDFSTLSRRGAGLSVPPLPRAGK
ncbi:MAG: transposase [Tropicimonas sp.]|uniref:transposase n=1 Tax=Tropicimonas sp. TaxID=2067044 RepID=UPI003A869842